MSNIYIQEPPTNGKVLLITSVGDIDIELWSKEAPRACRNFVQLCMEGYYDGTIFHRVISGFIAQGGDPTGTGHGGESIYGHPFKDEVHSRLRFVRRGLVAMANGGPNDNGSQFFFTLGTTPELMNKHTIFGKVSGNTVFNMLKLQECETDSEDRPVHPNKILRTQILANPYDDIIPRVLKRKKDADADKKPKSKSKATKNFKLLSFGEEAEEDEEQVMKVTEGWKGKSKSSHDLTNDPRLSAVPVMEMQEPPQKKLKEEKKSEDIKSDDKMSGRWDKSPEKSDDKQLEDIGSEDKKTVDKRSGRWDKSPDNKKLDDMKLGISDDKRLERSDDKRLEKSDDKRLEKSDDRRSGDKRLERSDDRSSEKSDNRRSERTDDRRSDDRRSERTDDRRSDDRRSERTDDRRSDDRRSERPDDRRSGDRRSDERRSERSEDKRSEERSFEAKKSDEKRKDDKRLSEKRPTVNSDEMMKLMEPEESREREERRETIRKKLKRNFETVEKEKRGEKVENIDPKPLSKSDELKQEARQLKKEIRESKKREEQRKAGNDENNKTDPDDVPPSSNDPLADFKRERQKYKNLRKQQGVKGQSREDITLSLLEKFKNKLNSAKTLAGDYSDEEEEKGLEEEDDASDLSWMHHKLQFDDKHHKVLDANVTDVERYEIFDPRNPLTKRRRDESKKSLKDKR